MPRCTDSFDKYYPRRTSTKPSFFGFARTFRLYLSRPPAISFRFKSMRAASGRKGGLSKMITTLRPGLIMKMAAIMADEMPFKAHLPQAMRALFLEANFGRLAAARRISTRSASAYHDYFDDDATTLVARHCNTMLSSGTAADLLKQVTEIDRQPAARNMINTFINPRRAD